jgi:hypothetical protein
MAVDAVGLWPASMWVTAGMHVDTRIYLHNTDPLSITYGEKIHLRDGYVNREAFPFYYFSFFLSYLMLQLAGKVILIYCFSCIGAWLPYGTRHGLAASKIGILHNYPSRQRLLRPRQQLFAALLDRSARLQVVPFSCRPL